MTNVPLDEPRRTEQAVETKQKFFFVLFGIVVALIVLIPLVLVVLGAFSGGMLVVVALGPVLFGTLAYLAIRKYL